MPDEMTTNWRHKEREGRREEGIKRERKGIGAKYMGIHRLEGVRFRKGRKVLRIRVREAEG